MRDVLGSSKEQTQITVLEMNFQEPGGDSSGLNISRFSKGVSLIKQG